MGLIDGMVGWKSLWASPLLAPFCGANKAIVEQAEIIYFWFLGEAKHILWKLWLAFSANGRYAAWTGRPFQKHLHLHLSILYIMDYFEKK